MSYVLHVWKEPRPVDAAEADGLLGRKLEQPGTAGADELATLAAALWKAYPSDPVTEPDDPVWSDSTLSTGHDGSDLLTLGFELEHAHTVMPEILRLANEFELVVVDLEAAAVHLPGKPGAPRAAKPRGKPNEVPGSPASAKTRLRKWFKAQLCPRGFEHEPGKHSDLFVRRFPGGEHVVAVSVGLADHQALRVSIGADTSLDLVLDTMERARGRREIWKTVTWSTRALARLASADDAAGPFPDDDGLFVLSRLEGYDWFLDALTALVGVVDAQSRHAETPAGAWQVLVEQLDAAPDAVVGSAAASVAILLGHEVGDVRYQRFIDRFLADQARRMTEAEAYRARTGDDIAVRNTAEISRDFAAFVEFIESVPPLPG